MKPRHRNSNVLTITLAAALVLLLAWIVVDSLRTNQRAEVAEEQAQMSEEQAQVTADNASILAGEIRAACERDGETARELGDLCQRAEVIEEEPTEPLPGPPGRAPTAAEVYAAVAEWCDRGRCRGPAGTDGRPGADAPPVSKADVAAAVAAYCTDDACRGRRGADGTDGRDSTVPGPQGEAGLDSTIPGPRGEPGRPPTSQEIAAAVAAYCTDDACRGETGAQGIQGEPGMPGTDGTDGTDGVDGRGIRSGPDFLIDDNGRCVARTIYTDGVVYDSQASRIVCIANG